MGETHEKTKESSEYLKHLTQQAVALQRTMNEIYKNGSNASIMPLKVAVPSQHVSVSYPFKSCRWSSLIKTSFFSYRFSVYGSQYDQCPGTAQHHQRHHLYTTQVTQEICSPGRTNVSGTHNRDPTDKHSHCCVLIVVLIGKSDSRIFALTQCY